MNNNLNIALAFDYNFINQFHALVSSIFANNSGSKIAVHAIISGINDSLQKDIRKRFNNHNAEITFYSVPDGFGENFVLNGNWTAATYYRLLFPELLPQDIEKYLYIDTDTIVVGSLLSLFEVDVNEVIVAAVRDKLVPIRPDLNLDIPFSYFNAGVLLVNKRKWIEEEVTNKAIDFLTNNPEKVKYADQDALNYIFNGRWIRLDTKYNLMFADIPEDLPKSEFNAYLSDKIIIHFTQHRPWNMLCRNRFRYLYFDYLKLSSTSNGKTYNDFSFQKLSAFFKIRLIEFYFDSPYLKNMWGIIKNKLK